MPSRESVAANRAKYRQSQAEGRLVVTDVDLDGETLLAIPQPVALESLQTYSTLACAMTLGHARADESARQLVEERLPMYLERQDGKAGFTGSDGDIFDAEDFFGADDWRLWKPNPRELTADFLTQDLPDLARRFLLPDNASGIDYQPTPWLPASRRAAVHAALEQRGYAVKAVAGLALMFLEPPLDLESNLG
ncbi:MAG: hypothetical protein JWL79_134 [Frankiales bacterium]|nr:hypothetical protein [Frankiales bacterium]